MDVISSSLPGIIFQGQEAKKFKEQVLMLTKKHDLYSAQLRIHGLSGDESLIRIVNKIEQLLEKQHEFVTGLGFTTPANILTKQRSSSSSSGGADLIRRYSSGSDDEWTRSSSSDEEWAVGWQMEKVVLLRDRIVCCVTRERQCGARFGVRACFSFDFLGYLKVRPGLTPNLYISI